MFDAPEKMIFQPRAAYGWENPGRVKHSGSWGVEYTRSDLVAELAAENERLKQRLADHPRATNTVDAHETANVSDKPEGRQEP